MDYLKPLIWILLIVILALGLHLLLELMHGADRTVEPATMGNGAVQKPVGPNDPPATTVPPVTPAVTPTPAPGPVVPVAPGPGPVVVPPVTPVPITPAPVIPTAAGIDRVMRDPWEKALLANGFVARAHPTLHVGDAEFTSYVYVIQTREVAWAFLQAGGDNLVVRLEFYVDGRDSATGMQAADDAAQGCLQIIKSFRALDKTLGDLCAPVLYSPYTSDKAFVAGNGFKGFARDVGKYICLRVQRTGQPVGQFFLLWKDPAGKVGALGNSVKFADQCKDTDWAGMPVPAEAK